MNTPRHDKTEQVDLSDERIHWDLGASISYASLPAEHAEGGTEVAVEVFGEWIDGAVRAEPLFDPKGTRVRG